MKTQAKETRRTAPQVLELLGMANVIHVDRMTESRNYMVRLEFFTALGEIEVMVRAPDADILRNTIANL
jgi:hypothetical protein